MRIGKPLMIGTTVIGIVVGLYEGWRFAGGLVFLMAMLMGFMGICFATVVMTIRRERREEEERKKQVETR
jgi:ABC-type dipeptide/oligopeptide/nickel transport system permease subunit